MIPDIQLIQMGGTIDKKYPQRQGAYAFEIEEASAPSLLKEMRLSLNIQSISIAQKDSQDLTKEDRQKLKSYIENSDCKRFIVTHGTDTMIETGQYISDLKNAIVILTGSFMPASCLGSDASAQLGASVMASQLVGPGVYVCMNGQIIPAREAVRDNETGTFGYAES